jgi:hypothetical protein
MTSLVREMLFFTHLTHLAFTEHSARTQHAIAEIQAPEDTYTPDDFSCDDYNAMDWEDVEESVEQSLASLQSHNVCVCAS